MEAVDTWTEDTEWETSPGGSAVLATEGAVQRAVGRKAMYLCRALQSMETRVGMRGDGDTSSIVRQWYLGDAVWGAWGGRGTFSTASSINRLRVRVMKLPLGVNF